MYRPTDIGYPLSRPLSFFSDYRYMLVIRLILCYHYCYKWVVSNGPNKLNRIAYSTRCGSNQW